MRKMVFNDKFYSGNKDKLLKFFNSIDNFPNKVRAYGLIVPHAGYIYSGKTAVKTFNSIELPQTCLIFCPNHRGFGEPVGVSVEDWDTPFGVVKVDKDLASHLLEIPYFKSDKNSHMYEHSLEVQLPILKWLNPNIQIVGVSIGTDNINVLNEIVNNLTNVINIKSTIFIASSDMSHFVTADEAEKLDSSVISELRHLDSEKMFENVSKNRISMCGVSPAYIVSKLCKNLGAVKGEVIEYTNSGYVTGDFTEVVAYLGMRFV